MNINGDVKIQSMAYSSAEQFFKDVKPPYFEDYAIEFVDGTENCYNTALSFAAKSAIVIILGLVMFFL